MHIQLVTYALQGITDADLRAGAEAVAPAFAALPGLASKVWLADPASNTYGGIYTWESEAAMRAYLDGPLFASMRENPTLAGVQSRAFAVLPEPTRITSPARPDAVPGYY